MHRSRFSILPSSFCCCLYLSNSILTTKLTLLKLLRQQNMNTASRRRTPAHLLARSLARLCTWRNMTGTRVENELIRWDANEREESGGAWRYALASESPGCRVVSDFVFKGSDTARQQLITSVGRKLFPFHCVMQ